MESPAVVTNGAIPASGRQPLPDLHEIPVRTFRPVTEPEAPLPDSVVRGDSDAGNSASESFVMRPDRPSSRDGPARLPGDSRSVSVQGDVSGGQVQEAGEDRRPTPAWADEEIDKLRALYPTHSAGAIAVELGEVSIPYGPRPSIWG